MNINYISFVGGAVVFLGVLAMIVMLIRDNITKKNVKVCGVITVTGIWLLLFPSLVKQISDDMQLLMLVIIGIAIISAINWMPTDKREPQSSDDVAIQPPEKANLKAQVGVTFIYTLCVVIMYILCMQVVRSDPAINADFVGSMSVLFSVLVSIIGSMVWIALKNFTRKMPIKAIEVFAVSETLAVLTFPISWKMPYIMIAILFLGGVLFGLFARAFHQLGRERTETNLPSKEKEA